MNQLLKDLYDFMEEREQGELVRTPGIRRCENALERSYSQIEEAMGEEFSESIREAVFTYTGLHAEAGFCWGLRLGLALASL